MSGNKAAVLYGPKDIRIEQRDIPSIGLGEVLIKSVDVSVCATEVKYWAYGIPGVPPSTKVVQGHELGGVVVDTARDCKELLGKKVVVDPSIWCGKCDMCLSGMANLCRNLQFMSLPPVDGGFQQFYKVPKRNVHVIPEEMSMEYASLVEPVAIAINAVRWVENFIGSIGGKVLSILGAGPLGLLVAQVASLHEPAGIHIFEPLGYRRALAKKIGAFHVYDPYDPEAQSIFIELTKDKGADVVFELSGEPDAYDKALQIIKPGGLISVIGIPSDQNCIPMKAVSARRLGITLNFVRRFNPLDLPRSIELVASKHVNVSSLITHFFSLDDISKAFEMLYRYEDNVVKVVIKPN